MKLSAVFIALLFFTFCVFAQGKNLLKVKINHEYKQDTGSTRKSTIQFKYDTTELLQVTNTPESSSGIYLRRNDVQQFKKMMEKMLKFIDAVYENKITGVKKEFKDRSLWAKNTSKAPVINVEEDLKTVTKYDIRVSWSFLYTEGGMTWASAGSWNYRELQELAKIFDEKQKEVFKKYDILKALND